MVLRLFVPLLSRPKRGTAMLAVVWARSSGAVELVSGARARQITRGVLVQVL